jgi:hypothetical protein
VIIEVDLRFVPPAISLLEPDDFTSLKLQTRGEHSFLDRETLLALAEDRALDPSWVHQLDAMLGYAASRGWVNEAGATRAHVEHISPQT